MLLKMFVAMPPLAGKQYKSVEPSACPDGVVERPGTDKQTPHSPDMLEKPVDWGARVPRLRSSSGVPSRPVPKISTFHQGRRIHFRVCNRYVQRKDKRYLAILQGSDAKKYLE